MRKLRLVTFFFIFYSLELQSHSSAIYELEESYKSKFVPKLYFRVL